MHDVVTSQGPKCFMVSETVSPTVINNLVVARQAAVLGLLLLVLPDAWGRCRLGLQPIMGAACQEPLGTCFLINALSDGVSTTQRPAQGNGKEKVIASLRNAWTGAVVSVTMVVNMVYLLPKRWVGVREASWCFFSAQSGFRLWFPLPVFEGILLRERISGCPPPLPHDSHRLLLWPMNYWLTLVIEKIQLWYALTCLFCGG